MNAAAALHVGKLSKRLGGRDALVAVDLDACGGVTAVLGPNGAGKTTLLRCISTVLAADTGVIRVDGMDAHRATDRTLIRTRLGYLPQRVSFNERARVFDAVDYLALLRGNDDERRRRLAVFEALDVVGLRDRALDRVGTLSGGLLQRLGVAQSIVGDPTLVVLDEPSVGLDPGHRLDLRSVVAALGARATVVVSTHLTDDVDAIAHAVVVLVSGQVVWTGSPAGLARVADGAVWIAPPGTPEGVLSRGAHRWRQPDGSERVLGNPPRGAAYVAPTIEDGYLLVSTTVRR